MVEPIEVVRVGDRIRISVEVIRQWTEVDAGFHSPLVTVREIRRDMADGTVILVVEQGSTEGT